MCQRGSSSVLLASLPAGWSRSWFADRETGCTSAPAELSVRRSFLRWLRSWLWIRSCTSYLLFASSTWLQSWNLPASSCLLSQLHSRFGSSGSRLSFGSCLPFALMLMNFCWVPVYAYQAAPFLQTLIKCSSCQDTAVNNFHEGRNEHIIIWNRDRTICRYCTGCRSVFGFDVVWIVLIRSCTISCHFGHTMLLYYFPLKWVCVPYIVIPL